jgi:hypothetical protein
MTPQNKRRLIDSIGPLAGLYECRIEPRKNTRSSQQNRYFHGVIVEMFYQFLRDQDYDAASPEAAKGFLKAKFLLHELVNPETGEVIGRRVKSTAELSSEEFGDFIDRARAWLADFFGLVIPDPDQDWRERSGPTKHKATA